jgi:hypothetical protein
MSATPVVKLPAFDTGEYEGCEFTMRRGDAVLTVRAASIPPFTIHFRRTRWHQFTAKYNCTPQQIEGCYFVLAEISPSASLQAFVAADKASMKAYAQLHHFRIFLDETGCHELFAESVSANNSLEGDACKATRASG